MNNSVPQCVGCGYCCKKVVCAEGHRRAKQNLDPPCPYLAPQEDGTYRCGLVLEAQNEELERLISSLSIGVGCSSSLFNTYREAILRKQELRSFLLFYDSLSD